MPSEPKKNNHEPSERTTNLSSGTELGYGSFWILFFYLSGIVSGIVILILATRILQSYEALGIMTFIILIRALLVTFSTFSLPVATSNFISQYLGRKEGSSAGLIHKRMRNYGLIIGLIVMTILLIFSGFISSEILGAPTQSYTISVFALEMPGTILIQFLHASLMGYKKYRSIGISGISKRVAEILLSTFLLLAGFGVFGIAIAWCVGAWVDVGLSMYFIPFEFRGSYSGEFPLKKIVQYSLPTYLSDSSDYFSQNIDRFIILFFGGSSLLGLYGPIVTLANLTLVIPMAISTAVFPQISRLQGANAKDAIETTARGAFRWLVILEFPIISLMIIESYFVVYIILGPLFIDTAITFSVVALSVLLSGMFQFTRILLLGLNKPKYLFSANITSLMAGGFVLMLLVPLVGITGAAIGRLFLVSTQLLISLYILAKEKIVFEGSIVKKTIIASTSVLLPSIAVHAILDSTFLSLVVSIVISVFVYMVLLRVSGALTDSDFDLIEAIVPSRLKSIISMIRRILTR